MRMKREKMEQESPTELQRLKDSETRLLDAILADEYDNEFEELQNDIKISSFWNT